MRMTLLALASALLITGNSAIAAPYDPYEGPSNCGFVNRNGTMVYLGACPGPDSDDTSPGPSTPEPEPEPG